MNKQKQKIIVIVGPTASGKSELAVWLAKRVNGEIISADSRQVYKGLDIGTGKVPGKWLPGNLPTSQRSFASWNIPKRKIFVHKGIPHHCIDFVPPQIIFNVADFKKCAENAIKDITSRGKIPIVAGGTGFYIDAVMQDISLPQVTPNKKLRNELGRKSAPELFAMLKKIDSARAKTIDPQNPRRLIRALEIAKALGRVPASKRAHPYRALWLGTKFSPQALRARIHTRLMTRIRHGMVEEAKRLHKHGVGWNRFYALGLEYRYLADFLRGKLSKGEMRRDLDTAIRQYARRQTVWFKQNREIHWLKNKKEAERLSRKFLSA